MKKYIYSAGTIALALAMSSVPAFAFAEGSIGDVQVTSGVTAQATTQSDGGTQSDSQSVSGSGSAYAQVGGGNRKPSITGGSEGEGSGSVGEQSNAGVSNGGEHSSEMESEGLPFNLATSTSFVFSSTQLDQSIKVRAGELDQEEASSSPEMKQIFKNENPVRLAVHSLLASKDLLGGIGGQVSVIAQQMNDSVASTTKAEMQIQSRGFLTKLLFGGDSAAAQVITQSVAQNQARIDDLNKLLAQANVAADVQVTLKAQITALEAAQVRLQDLAKQEQSMWGIFSWRF